MQLNRTVRQTKYESQKKLIKVKRKKEADKSQMEALRIVAAMGKKKKKQVLVLGAPDVTCG